MDILILVAAHAMLLVGGIQIVRWAQPDHH